MQEPLNKVMVTSCMVCAADVWQAEILLAMTGLIESQPLCAIAAAMAWANDVCSSPPPKLRAFAVAMEMASAA